MIAPKANLLYEGGRYGATGEPGGTREHPLEAGRLALARNGHNGTSIADIAGFSQGAFNSNYEGKQAPLLALLRRYKEQDIATLTRILGGAEQGKDAASALDRYLDVLSGDADRARLDIELQWQAAATGHCGRP